MDDHGLRATTFPMRQLAVNAHKQDLERVEVVADLSRWTGGDTSGGNQFWNRPLSSSQQPHVLGVKVARQTTTFVAGVSLAPNGKKVSLDGLFVYGGFLEPVELPVEAPHSYVCLWQNVGFETQSYPDPELGEYKTGAFTATYRFRVIPATDVSVSQDIVTLPGDNVNEATSFGTVLAEITKDSDGNFSLIGPLNGEHTPLSTTASTLFTPYAGFGYFGAGSLQITGLLAH